MTAPRRPRDRPTRPPAGTTWALPVLTVPAGQQLVRISQRRFPDPAFFGRQILHRFDAPDASYGVCYLATSLDGSLLEVFELARDAATGRATLSVAELRVRYAALATVVRPLRLAELADDGLARLGLDQRVTGGDDYDLAGAWLAAIQAHAAGVDGLFYASRHHNRCYNVALFERARDAVTWAIWGGLGKPDPADLWVATVRALDRFAIDLIDPPGP
jgi:hypothetical protein